MTRNETLLILAALLAATLCTSSCVTDRTKQYAPAGMASLVQPVPDPLEPYNRVVQDFNKGMEKGVIHPVAQVWRFLLPEFLRTGISNFGNNLSYPLHAVNHLLQGDPGLSWQDTKRFVVNTTVGVLGLWDPATGWGMPDQPTGFGETFAKWGVGEGCYFNMPLLGPGTLRDTAGALADIPLNPTQWLLSREASLATDGVVMGNRLALTEPELYAYFSTQYNDYESFKLATLLLKNPENRFKDIQGPENPQPDDTLGALQMKPADPAFFYESRQRNARLPNGGVVPYTCFPTRGGAAGLVVILPGIGTHRNSAEVIAYAELFRRHGYDTLTISSTFLPDFFEGLENTPPPGLIPEDVKLLSQVLDTAINDYREHFNVPETQPCVLMGYSLGGLNALHLAAYQKKGGEPALPVQRYVALNPPRNPLAALQKLDELAAYPEQWPEEERELNMQELVDRLGAWMNAPAQEESLGIPPLTQEESLFLVGVAMRLSLAETVIGLEKRNPTGALQEDPRAYFHRNNLYAEALGFTYDDYVQKIFLPWYRNSGYQGDPSVDSSLDAAAETLQDADNIFVFQNRNDFLIRPEDAEWYTDTFGKRCLLFDRGGHLGSVYREDYQQALLQVLLPVQQ